MLEQPGANVTPVPAATVVMIRDSDHGLETWMMRRVRAMAFAPTAAVREVFEEASVLLADPLPADLDLAPARAAIESRDLTLAQFLADSGCALHAWARWVTPPVERRRYDTWFFVTSLPAGIDAKAAGSEADRSGWIAVSEVLRAYVAGGMHVLPPTVTMLRGLAKEGSVAAVLAVAPERVLEPVHPQITVTHDRSIELVAAGETFRFPAPASSTAAPA
jgi:8-oxo-dGTP pyrophosphatase MutT (NUDIX family)